MARIGAVVFLVTLLSGLAMGQDPGIPDSVSFGPWEAIVPADSPWAGNIRVPIRVYNDNPLAALQLVFKWNGPWTPVKARFSGNRAKFMSITDFEITDSYINMGTYAPPHWIPADTGVIGYLCFIVLDTGTVDIDWTSTPLEHVTTFYDTTGFPYYPRFTSLEDTLHFTNLVPGDFDVDGESDLADIVGLAKFVLHRAANPPPILNLCDVNADCKVDLVDVVYLVNVVLRGRFTAKYGCAC